jgi:hypothetical protein
MKPSFSPWLPYSVLLVLAAGCYAYIDRDTPFRLGISGPAAIHGLTPNGIVRSLHGDQPAVATVVLRDGSTVDAPVAPGCFVQTGDRVFVSDADGKTPRLVFSVQH